MPRTMQVIALGRCSSASRVVAEGTSDQLGAGKKFITPMTVNGRVYVGTANGAAVFGFLH